MEWRQIEEKWLEMTGKLKTGAQGRSQPGATVGTGSETPSPKDDPSPAQDESNARIIA